MNRIIKIFCQGKEQKELGKKYKVLERYDGFLLVEIATKDLKSIGDRFIIEDITDLYALKIGDTEIDTSIPRLDAKGKTRAHPAYKGIKALSRGRHHYLVQFIGPIKEKWLKEISAMGGELREPYGDFTYIVRSDEDTLARIMGLPSVRWLGHLPHKGRIAAGVLDKAGRKAHDIYADLPRTRVMPGIYSVEFFSADDLSQAIPSAKQSGINVMEDAGKVMIVAIEGTTAQVKQKIGALATIHGVRSIKERSVYRTCNDVAAVIMGTTTASGNTGLGLSGNGEYIGICDTGLDTGIPATIHKDFAKRVYFIKSYPINSYFSNYINNPGGDDGPADLDSGHGTHVAGSVLGNGAASIGLSGVASPIRGLAYRAKLVFQAVEQEMKWKRPGGIERFILAGIPNDLQSLFHDAYAKKARIHSNSWGGGDPGAYDAQCEQLDRFIWEHKDFCILFSAGNDGTDNDGDGKINPTSVTAPGTSKNCITIGACENRRPGFNSVTYGSWWPDDYPSPPIKNDPMADNPDQVVAFSSRGPTKDNRFKPDLVAPGTFILSTRSTQIAANNMGWAAFPQSKFYFHMGGTSMATPLTSGSVALVREYLRKKKKIKKPSAALLKAAMVAGAQRLPGYAPAGAIVDNHQGYGRVNIDAVLSPAAPATSRFIEVKPGLQTGGVWSLELDIKSSSVPLKVVLVYSDYPGERLVNNLNLIASAPDGKKLVGNSPAGSTKVDTSNNVEAIQVLSPATGKWKIDVVASNIPNGPQDFALVCIGHIA